MEAFKPKWDNSILDIIGVNSLKLGSLQVWHLIHFFSNILIWYRSKRKSVNSVVTQVRIFRMIYWSICYFYIKSKLTWIMYYMNFWLDFKVILKRKDDCLYCSLISCLCYIYFVYGNLGLFTVYCFQCVFYFHAKGWIIRNNIYIEQKDQWTLNDFY